MPPSLQAPGRPGTLAEWMSRSREGRAFAWDLPLFCLDSFICQLAIMLLDNGKQNQLISKTAGGKKGTWQVGRRAHDRQSFPRSEPCPWQPIQHVSCAVLCSSSICSWSLCSGLFGPALVSYLGLDLFCHREECLPCRFHGRAEK